MEAEEIFWNWFVNHKDGIASRLDANETNNEIFDQLNEKLYQYNELLFGEITGDKNGKYILVLTCDGRAKGAYPLTKLAHFAPDIDGWVIQQFRKPGRVLELNFQGLELKAEDFRFKHWMEDEKHYIDIFIPGYKENDTRFQSLAFLYLDHFVGEYEVMTKIRSIGFKKLSRLTSKKELIGITELNKRINN